MTKSSQFVVALLLTCISSLSMAQGVAQLEKPNTVAIPTQTTGTQTQELRALTSPCALLSLNIKTLQGQKMTLDAWFQQACTTQDQIRKDCELNANNQIQLFQKLLEKQSSRTACLNSADMQKELYFASLKSIDKKWEDQVREVCGCHWVYGFPFVVDYACGDSNSCAVMKSVQENWLKNGKPKLKISFSDLLQKMNQSCISQFGSDEELFNLQCASKDVSACKTCCLNPGCSLGASPTFAQAALCQNKIQGCIKSCSPEFKLAAENPKPVIYNSIDAAKQALRDCSDSYLKIKNEFDSQLVGIRKKIDADISSFNAQLNSRTSGCK